MAADFSTVHYYCWYLPGDVFVVHDGWWVDGEFGKDLNTYRERASYGLDDCMICWRLFVGIWAVGLVGFCGIFASHMGWHSWTRHPDAQVTRLLATFIRFVMP